MRIIKLLAGVVAFVAVIGLAPTAQAAPAPAAHTTYTIFVPAGSTRNIGHSSNGESCDLTFRGGTFYASAHASISYEPAGGFSSSECSDYTYVMVVGRNGNGHIVYGPQCGYGNSYPGFAGCGLGEYYERVETYIPWTTAVSAVALLCNFRDCTQFNIWIT